MIPMPICQEPSLVLVLGFGSPSSVMVTKLRALLEKHTEKGERNWDLFVWGINHSWLYFLLVKKGLTL